MRAEDQVVVMFDVNIFQLREMRSVVKWLKQWGERPTWDFIQGLHRPEIRIRYTYCYFKARRLFRLAEGKHI